MQEACEAAGLEPLTFHELRHSYASLLVNAGCPLVYVAAQFGTHGHPDGREALRPLGALCPG
jgi:integrase